MIMPAIILMRPSAILWTVTVGAVVLLYLRAIRPPRVVVSRPYLWRQVLGEPRSSAPAWFRRRLGSAAIHVGVVLLLALAAADPCLRRPRTVVFVVDNSRSMEAVENGVSRFARAQAVLADHLETMGPREYAALITTAGHPVVVSPAEQNLDRVAAAAQRIRTVDLRSRIADAVKIAAGLAASGTHLQIHVISDGCFDGADTMNLGPGTTIHPLGTLAGNAAVTRLAVRRYPNDQRQFQMIVEVTNRSDTALSAPLRVDLNGKSIHQADCQAAANSTTTVIADLESDAGGPLVATLASADAIAGDNCLELILPDKDQPMSPPAVQPACDPRSPLAWCAEPPAVQTCRVAPLWPWLVLAALTLLAIEWTLHHRRWTC
ncbi:MAG: VWA domain-containing protein [Planctomycetaceae bacterium]|nr:VWA domain-containing protein [Planctomycetaceae bacterium]